jgi:adenylate kinase family enzyme
MSEDSHNLPGIDEPRIAAPPVENSRTVKAWDDTDLHDLWRRRVVESDNDLVVAVAASSRSGISGTGKTTLAVQLARRMDNSKSGFDATKRAALSSEKVANDLIPNTETGGSIIFDEAQGTLVSDGVDSRRGMASAVVDMTRAAAQYRVKQHTLVVVAQTTDWIDSRMMDMLDRLIVIQSRGRAIAYDHYRDDLPRGGSKREYTPATEELYWDALDDDDPDYAALEEMKERANKGEQGDDDDSANEDRQIARAAVAKHQQGKTWREIEAEPWAEFSREWYRTHVDDLSA